MTIRNRLMPGFGVTLNGSVLTVGIVLGLAFAHTPPRPKFLAAATHKRLPNR